MRCSLKIICNFIDAHASNVPALRATTLLLTSSVLNTALKVISTPLAMLPVNGEESKVNRWAHDGYQPEFWTNENILPVGAQHILPSILFIGLRLLNPYSKGFHKKEIQPNDSFRDCVKKMVSCELFEGPLTKIVHGFFQRAIEKARDPLAMNTDSTLHIRGLFLLGTVSIILSKGTELAGGLVLGTCALLSLGLIPQINSLAMQYLSSLNGIEEACAGLIGVCNPKAEIYSLARIWNI